MRLPLLHFTRKSSRLFLSIWKCKHVNQSVFKQFGSSAVTTSFQSIHRKYYKTTVKKLKEDDETLFEKETYYSQDSILKDVTDPIVQQLDKCLSAEEVLSTFHTNRILFKPMHLEHTVRLLNDFCKICSVISGEEVSEEFAHNLVQHDQFAEVLKEIVHKVDEFDIDSLNNIHYYLYKVGVNLRDPFLQSITFKMRRRLLDDFTLRRCAKFLTTVRVDSVLRPFILGEELLPLIVSKIGSSKTVEQLGILANCLNKINHIVTEVIALKLRDKVDEIVNTVTAENKHVFLLQIVCFLNNFHWRQKCSPTLTHCILLMNNNIDKLNMNELILLYRAFHGQMEPGSVLNTLQRCSSRFLQSDEILASNIQVQLELFSSIIFFGFPPRRLQYKELIEKYLQASKTISNLVLLKRILTFVKISDKRVCDIYWDKMILVLKSNTDINTILTACEHYSSFHTDIDNYRHPAFEKAMLNYLNNVQSNLFSHFPSIICTAFCFTLLYSDNDVLKHYFLNQLDKNYTQLDHSDSLKLSRTIDQLNNSNKFKGQVVSLLNQTIQHQMNFKCSPQTINHLIRASVALDNPELTKKLLDFYVDFEPLCSKVIEIAVFSMRTSQILIPEFIDRLADYVISNQDLILGFNVEKLLYLCYELNYCPKSAEKFFEVSTNIIIRDLERLSGLTFLNSALSLCYFNHLPSSFIKAIFNVEFMEKLDSELANCYAKDTYPQKVRNTLMKLNRAVCLEYPQYNVPWFHQNYVNDHRTNDLYFKQEFVALKRILPLIVRNRNCFTENVSTPYGYHIDYVLYLDNNGDFVMENSENISRKVALLILLDSAYTESTVNLKGSIELKKRHLEMLGYSVVTVRDSEWKKLVHTRERLEFLTTLLNNVKFK